MLRNFKCYKIQNIQTIYGGSNRGDDNGAIETMSLSFGDIPVTTEKPKNN